jgi:hypothetical protein
LLGPTSYHVLATRQSPNRMPELERLVATRPSAQQALFRRAPPRPSLPDQVTHPPRPLRRRHVCPTPRGRQRQTSTGRSGVRSENPIRSTTLREHEDRQHRYLGFFTVAYRARAALRAECGSRGRTLRLLPMTGRVTLLALGVCLWRLETRGCSDRAQYPRDRRRKLSSTVVSRRRRCTRILARPRAKSANCPSRLDSRNSPSRPS